MNAGADEKFTNTICSYIHYARLWTFAEYL